MKVSSVVLMLGTLIGTSAFSAPTCVTGSLASYVSLGSGGCAVGIATFSGFNTLPPITGATAIPVSAINISPFQSGNTVGLNVTVGATATSGQLLETLLGYMVTATGITSSTVTLSNTSASGGGIVTDIQNFCRGGSFRPNDVTGCTNSGALVVLNSGSDQKTFPPVNSLAIVHDLTLDAGARGTASAGVVMDRFATAGAATSGVPEPSTYALFSSALLGLAIRSRFRNRAGNM